jgi:para-aminobenzoate synthetase/4-amino-4-deoxychorismate lyase
VTAAPPRPDRSLGVFETLLVRNRAAQAIAAHIERMSGSTERLYGLLPPADVDDRVRARAERLGDGEHRMRVDARPVGRELRLEFETTPLAPRPALWRLTPLALSGGYGPDKLADRGPLESSASGGPVALLVDGAGPDADVLEASWANVWLLDGERLITPPCDGRILPGVTRARVLELAGALGLVVEERPISLSRAGAAPLMLTSSLQLATPASLADAPPSPPEGTELVARIRAALLSSGWE